MFSYAHFLKINNTFYLLILIIFLHIFLISKIQFFPYPELFLFPYLTNSGLLPYSNIIDQHFPGLLFLPVNFSTLGMTTPEISRYYLMGLVLFNHVFIFLITHKFFSKNRWSIVSNIFYLIWQPILGGGTLWIDNFETIFILPIFYILLNLQYKKNKIIIKLFFLGVLIGIATVIKQNYVLLLLPVLFWLIYLNNFKVMRSKIILECLTVVAGIIIPLVVVFSYFLNLGVLANLLYWTVNFNIDIYSKYHLWPTKSEFLRTAFGYLPILMSLVVFKTGKYFLIFFFIIVTTFTIISRFDFVYLQPSLPFIAIISSPLLFNFKKNWQPILIYTLLVGYLLVVFYRGHLSSEILLFGKNDLELSEKIKTMVAPKEKIFLFGVSPHYYYLTNTLPSGDLLVYQLPWYMEVAQQGVLDSLIAQPPKLIVEDRTVNIEGHPIAQYAFLIDSYINTNFKEFDSLGNIKFMVPK